MCFRNGSNYPCKKGAATRELPGKIQSSWEDDAAEQAALISSRLLAPKYPPFALDCWARNPMDAFVSSQLEVKGPGPSMIGGGVKGRQSTLRAPDGQRC